MSRQSISAEALREQTQRPKASMAFAKVIPCRRCEQKFQSWDYRKNRICEKCKNTDDWRASGAFNRPAGTATPARLAF